jgi:hypothetical protein
MLTVIAASSFVVCFGTVGFGQVIGLVQSPLVSHPVTHPLTDRTPYSWRQGSGVWGENFADQILRLRGYDEVYEIKTRSNQGIDRVAVKRDPAGRINDVRFVEVKTNRQGSLRLSNTKRSGQQLSRDWTAARMKAMRRSNDPRVKDLAREIHRFAKNPGKSLESLGEAWHIQTHMGQFTRYAADGTTELSSGSVERLLGQLQRRAPSSETRVWAGRSLANWDQIRATEMPEWLEGSGRETRNATILKTGGRASAALEGTLVAQGRRAVMKRALARIAGPLAALIALALDVKEMVDTERAYRSGAISLRQRNIREISISGGVAGAWTGVWAGGIAGMWIGSFGGPVAWVTVPVGGFVGATIGGIGGYIGGAAVAGYAATAWYDSIDSRIRERFEAELLSMPFPSQSGGPAVPKD